MQERTIRTLLALKESITGGTLRQGIKNRIKNSLRTAKITVLAIAIMANNLLSYNASAQSAEQKNKLQEIANYRDTALNAHSTQQREEIVAYLVNTYADTIYAQINELIMGKRWMQASTQLDIFERFASGLKDDETTRKIKELRASLKEEQEMQTIMDKAEHERLKTESDPIIRTLKRNDIGKSSIQEIDGHKYITFTMSSKDRQMAVDKSLSYIGVEINKSSIKVIGSFFSKVEQDGNIFVATVAFRIQ
jgi:hypothetical protein